MAGKREGGGGEGKGRTGAEWGGKPPSSCPKQLADTPPTAFPPSLLSRPLFLFQDCHSTRPSPPLPSPPTPHSLVLWLTFLLCNQGEKNKRSPHRQAMDGVVKSKTSLPRVLYCPPSPACAFCLRGRHLFLGSVPPGPASSPLLRRPPREETQLPVM